MSEQEIKPYKVDSVRTVQWLSNFGPPASHLDKLRTNHDFFYFFMNCLCDGKKDEEDEFKAERAFYHLNPEE